MKRVVRLTYIGVALACFAGCSHWHKKHYARAYAYEPCGCGEAISAPYDGVAVPTTQMMPGPPIKVSPAPQAPVVSTPQR
jgi:hypothetical protein